jgi:hypothetical protein
MDLIVYWPLLRTRTIATMQWHKQAYAKSTVWHSSCPLVFTSPTPETLPVVHLIDRRWRRIAHILSYDRLFHFRLGGATSRRSARYHHPSHHPPHDST